MTREIFILSLILVACGEQEGSGSADSGSSQVGTQAEIAPDLSVSLSGPPKVSRALASVGILVGGAFEATSQDHQLGNLVPLTASGQIVEQWASTMGTGFNGEVTSLLVASDKIWVGGDFTEFNGVSAVRLARLNLDGSLDEEFQSLMGLGFDGPVLGLSQDADGDVLAVGNFSAYNGAAAHHFALIRNADATLDATYKE